MMIFGIASIFLIGFKNSIAIALISTLTIFGYLALLMFCLGFGMYMSAKFGAITDCE